MNPLLRSLLLLASSGAFLPPVWSRFEELALPPEAFYLEGEKLWEGLGCSPQVISTLRSHDEGDWPEREAERAAKSGIRLLTFKDRAFPDRLRNIPSAPCLLYVRGEGELSEDSVAVVGTRRCTAYGGRVARGIGRAAAEAGGTVVSGGASGIDGAAHEGCLSAEGITLAVLGTGVNVAYPRNHEGLFERIASSGGALLSEYPLDTPPRPWRFPERNRIVAALAERTVIVEAPLKSGAMITARLALEMGREVWAVPGRINETGCEGSNRLLYDGAQALVSIPDFIALAFESQLSLFPLFERGEGKNSSSLDEKESRILAVLKKYGEKTVDNLAVEGKMSPADVFSCLATLSAGGLIFPSGPGRWSAAP
ncbi:DNA-processing protein DprA [Aminivibrio sp.]